MKLLRSFLWYIICFAPAVVLSLVAMLIAPAIVYLFMNRETGQLPYWLLWFQPTDTYAGCYDTMWIAEHPEWSGLKCAWTFIQRNPAYGFLEFCNCRDYSPTKVYGNPKVNDASKTAGWHFVLAEKGNFQFRFVYPIPFTNSCIQHDSGWQLITPTHKTFGMLQLAPIRFYGWGVK